MQIIIVPASTHHQSNLKHKISPCPASSISSSSLNSSSSGSELDYDGTEQASARKRQKLDHLTEQEKLFRRKLKNRVAAQTARDKKKAKMDQLEIIVEELRIENERLKAENKFLLAENARLSNSSKNDVIDALSEDVSAPHSVDEMYPIESAELINEPLPQEQGYIQSAVLRMLLQIMLLLESSTHLSTSSSSTQKVAQLVALVEQLHQIWPEELHQLWNTIQTMSSKDPSLLLLLRRTKARQQKPP